MVGGHSCDPHERCVDEHTDYSCDYISDFQMEVVSKEKVCEIIDDCGLNACRTGDCVNKVNGYTCDCDDDHELLQVNGSACVARNMKISFSNEFKLKVYGATQC